jgi:hypothetical protein
VWLCFSVSVYVSVCVNQCVCLCVSECVYLCEHVCGHTHHTHTHPDTPTQTHPPRHTHSETHTQTQTHRLTDAHTHTQTHTYTHLLAMQRALAGLHDLTSGMSPARKHSMHSPVSNLKHKVLISNMFYACMHFGIRRGSIGTRMHFHAPFCAMLDPFWHTECNLWLHFTIFGPRRGSTFIKPILAQNACILAPEGAPLSLKGNSESEMPEMTDLHGV